MSDNTSKRAANREEVLALWRRAQLNLKIENSGKEILKCESEHYKVKKGEKCPHCNYRNGRAKQ